MPPVASRTQLMLSRAGIARDITQLNSQNYTNGRWCRFYQGKPRKMGGYRQQQSQINGLARALQVDSVNGNSFIHLGTQADLQRYQIDINTGLQTGLISRTPVAFPASPDNNWQFFTMYDTGSTASYILAHAAPNISDITDDTERLIYYGDLTATTALASISGSDCSGGVFGLGPYLVGFGNYGEVFWSAPGLPTDLVGAGSGDARPVGDKIVRGMPLRGTSGPAGLLWSLSSLIRMQFVGTPTIFNFDTITTASAILSSNGVIEHNGIYYWATVSGFSMFNGVMRDIPNDMNLNWFLDNLNFEMRQKVFAFKIPRWKEIWWCFPFGSATECTHAIIFNWGEGTWYDTELPVGMRTAGTYEQMFRYPILTDAELVDGLSSSWQHDFGLDEVRGSSSIAISSFFETHEFNSYAPTQFGAQGVSNGFSFQMMEPDFNQIGDLTIQPIVRTNARAQDAPGEITVIPASPTSGEQITKFKRDANGRLVRFRVESNVAGGYYQAGAPVLHFVPSDNRMET